VLCLCSPTFLVNVNERPTLGMIGVAIRGIIFRSHMKDVQARDVAPEVMIEGLLRMLGNCMTVPLKIGRCCIVL
jgi:hypothetical protein